MEKKWVFGCFTLGCMTAVEIVALYLGHDSNGLAIFMGAVGTVVGIIIGRKVV